MHNNTIIQQHYMTYTQYYTIAQYYIYTKHIHHISQHIIYKLYTSNINNICKAVPDAPCHERTADAFAMDVSAICPSVKRMHSSILFFALIVLYIILWFIFRPFHAARYTRLFVYLNLL